MKDMRMTIWDLWEKLLCRIRLSRSRRFDIYADVDESGLINQEYEHEDASQSNQSLVKKVDKQQSLDRIQEGFNRLVDQLGTINSNFNQHISQQKELMERIAQMPRIMENFPVAIENQQRTMEQLWEQFKASALKTQEFVDVVKKLQIGRAHV